MLKAINILILNRGMVLEYYLGPEYTTFTNLIKNLETENYYFFGGYNTHTVFICKYKDMIIVGNVGGGINMDDIDNNNMVKAIKYYKFDIKLLMILFLYNDFINEKLYIEIIKKLSENETSKKYKRYKK